MKKSICKYLDIADVTTVRMIYAMLKEHSMPTDESEELYHELETRRKAIGSGQSKLYTVEEAIEYIRSKRPKRKK